MSRYVPLSCRWVTHVISLPVTRGNMSMQWGIGRPSRPGNTAGSGVLQAQSPDSEPASGGAPRRPGPDRADLATDDIQVVLPVLTDPGQLPPDRPRPPELAGPPRPGGPGQLPRRPVPPDPSRPSVPCRQPRRPTPPIRAIPPEAPARPGPP